MSYENRHILKDGDIVLYTRNGSPKYHARIRLPGAGAEVKSTGENDLNDAIRVALNRYEDLRYKSRHGLEVRTHTFASVYKNWLAANRPLLSEPRLRYLEGTAKRYFLPFFGERNVEAINDKIVAEYWIWRINYWTTPQGAEKIETARKSRATKARPYVQKLGNVAKKPAAKTLEMEKSALRQILRWAHRSSIINRIPEIKPPKAAAGKEIARRPAFELSEAEALFNFLFNWAGGNVNGKTSRLNSSHIYQRGVLRAYVMFMLNSGLRPNEARQLKWKDIGKIKDTKGLYQMVIHVSPLTKTGERDCIPLYYAQMWLDALRDLSTHTQPEDFIFCSTSGKPIDNFGKTFKQVLVEAGLLVDSRGRPRTIYSLRHTYATLRLLQGVEVDELAQNMGTSPTQIYRHYRHITTLQKASELGGSELDGILGGGR